MDNPINTIMTRSLAPTVEQYNADAAIKVSYIIITHRLTGLILKQEWEH